MGHRNQNQELEVTEDQSGVAVKYDGNLLKRALYITKSVVTFSDVIQNCRTSTYVYIKKNA